jgi:hypothetical protein
MYKAHKVERYVIYKTLGVPKKCVFLLANLIETPFDMLCRSDTPLFKTRKDSVTSGANSDLSLAIGLFQHGSYTLRSNTTTATGQLSEDCIL